MRIRLIVVGASVAALALSGCGDDQQTASGPGIAADERRDADPAHTAGRGGERTTPASDARLGGERATPERPVDETDAIAAQEYIERADTVCAELDDDLDRAQEGDQGIVLERGIARLEAIPAAEGDERKVDELLDAGREAQAALVNPQELDGDPFRRFSELAKEAGLRRGCGPR